MTAQYEPATSSRLGALSTGAALGVATTYHTNAPLSGTQLPIPTTLSSYQVAKPFESLFTDTWRSQRFLTPHPPLPPRLSIGRGKQAKNWADAGCVECKKEKNSSNRKKEADLVNSRRSAWLLPFLTTIPIRKYLLVTYILRRISLYV